MVMFAAISRATLAAYHRLIKHYANRYGEKVWSLVYQADTRARQEHLPRQRTIAIEKHSTATTLGHASTFDASRPWETAMQMVIADQNFWKMELEEPCFFALTRVGSVAEFNEGDAPIVSNARPTLTAGPGAQARVDIPNKPSAKRKSHTVDEHGLATHNRSGTPICIKYNRGECQPSTDGNRCPVEPSRSHQCSRCLQPFHVCSTPGSCTAALRTPPSGVRNGGGKGRGGGKGKGKGKGKRW